MVRSRYVINMYGENSPSQEREIRFIVKKNAFVAHWVEQWNADALHGSSAINICELSLIPAMDSECFRI